MEIGDAISRPDRGRDGTGVKVSGYVILNGRLAAAARAAVSVFDRGLLYGDGLFETMRAYRGVPFALEDHLRRLRLSAETLGLPIPDLDWPALIAALLEKNGLGRDDAWVRLTVTRGAGEPRLPPPDDPAPTSIVMARPLDAAVARNQRRGVQATLLPMSRDGAFSEHKSLNYLPGVVGRGLAARRGAYEGLFVGPEGLIAEGTTTSVFAVRGRALLTPPGRGILPGITRRLVLDIARDHGIDIAEHPLSTADLLGADEGFLTSSIVEIVPIVRVDDAVIGAGRPGPVARRLLAGYRRAVRAYVRQAQRGAPA